MRVLVCGVATIEDRAAVPAVAAAGPAARDAFLAAESQAAAAAVAGLDVNIDFVYEHQKNLVIWSLGHLVS